MAVACSQASGSTFPIGITTVTCSASDGDDSPSKVTASFRVTVLDTDLALNAPANITVNATSPSGAAVSYPTPAGVDEDATPPSVSCDHASGSTFPIGTTAVTCTATDGDDSPSSVTATFTVTVNDTDLALPAPANITVNATSPSGAPVTYTLPAALDEDAGAPVVTCDHPSGSTFFGTDL